ncbi:putative gns1 sur4 family protein [Diplodia seriata]|uniref:Elongation of fatty acids protein n=1 Tax=Diplodia seriata TaxID=420778 RepID=A0A0G2DZ82_9PEZI|nr:putative gns1 sur4 family protein [Diplodia seriata]
MSGPTFHLELPSRDLFKFPPDWAPPALAPPQATGTLRAPFGISAETYNALLSPKVPATIATVYAVTVVLLNRYNKSRGNKPWAISKTRIFFAFVILHNVFLAVYSGITNVAMARALYRLTPGLGAGLVENVDAYCKIHGPRGLGNAATFNNTNDAWEVKNTQILLGANGEPDPTDVGRMWNEGLAFWGWWFYLSKFYEVLDTAIILAKGKRSSTLQTYHHAGAMLCMWAGIRFMSAPIWMFVFINSGIHALMYTYYTVSALGVRVPQPVKRALTTMQIAQFVIGANFAAIHLFISYTVPVSTPYTLVHHVTSAAAEAASAVSSSATSVAAAASATGIGAVIKKMLLRAAGEEGLAENVRDDSGNIFGPEAVKAAEAREEIKWRDEYVRVPCIDTTGQSFAIWLNVIYLLPLTALFVRFFVRSYTKRTSQTSKANASSKAAKDAAHGVEREMHSTNGSANGKPKQNGSAKQENGGLSTTDPNKTEKSYADMMKH